MANAIAKTPVKPSTTPTKTVSTAKKTVKETPSTSTKSNLDTKISELPVQSRMAPLEKKKKNDKKKVIRDSFSFPEHDYHKISELKKICLAAGVHVKKGEILRVGLNLLTELKLSELLRAVEKVEQVKTGRPKSHKD